MCWRGQSRTIHAVERHELSVGSVHPYEVTAGDPTPLLHPPAKSLAWPWSEDTPRIESAWVQGFCTHTVNTGRLTPLWRDCGILTWSSRISLGAISRELGLWPTPSPALVLSEGAGTLLWALRGKSSPRGVGRGRWGLRRAQALATETKDRSDKSCVGKPNRVLCGAKE